MGLVAPRHMGSSQPGIKAISPALVGGFFTTEPPGKHLSQDIDYRFLCYTLGLCCLSLFDFLFYLFIYFLFFFSSTSLLLPTHLPTPSCTHAQSCNPMDFSPPDSSVHGFFQARILEWVAISFSIEITLYRAVPVLMEKMTK